MIIPVNKSYRIAADAQSWMIQKSSVVKSGKDKGKTVWTSIKWPGTYEHCVDRLLDLQIRLSDAETLADAIKDVQKIAKEARKALVPQVEIK